MNLRGDFLNNDEDKNMSNRIDLNSNPDENDISNDPKKAGKFEAEKDAIKDENIDKQKLDNLISVSNKILFSAQTVFPFDFFPKKIIIDFNQIHFVSKMFFLSDHIRSVDIRDIGDVSVALVPFFATLTITDKNFNDLPIVIKYLKKDDALKIRRIVQGMTISRKMDIDISTMEDDVNLVEKLEKLGSSKRFNEG